MEQTRISLKLVGSTASTRLRPVQQTSEEDAQLFRSTSDNEQDIHPAAEEYDFFKSAQWSSDGTCIVTNSDDNKLRTFVLPPNLLDEKIAPHYLKPYSIIDAPEPVYAVSIYPFFNLQEPSTTLHLSAPRGHPIALHSSLHGPSLLASYPLIHAPTETYLTPHSLLWTQSGTHFLTGSDSLIALFDVSRNGEGPMARYPTIPSKRKKIVGGGVGMKGIISALGVSSESILAAGTFTRQIGLYDAEGSGECIAVFALTCEGDGGGDVGGGGGGGGVTEVLWSPCGRYLYIAERKSEGITAYDIRVAGKRLAFLKGRRAMTNQRLGIDVVSTPQGHEIWAGGTDGAVRVWKGPVAEETEGGVDPVWSWDAHEDAVSSAIVRPSGLLVATCSGQRHITNPLLVHGCDTDCSDSTSDDDDDDGDGDGDTAQDNSLKIWSL